MPPARLRVPSNAPTVPHSGGDETGAVTVEIRNIVVPYISIRSPGLCASTLIASAHASMVPAVTGMPAGRPVAAAADSVIVPATVSDQASRGGSIAPAISPPRFVPFVRTGVVERHRLTGRMMVEHVFAGELPHEVRLGMNSVRARANAAGSWSATQATFGPTAWLVSASRSDRRSPPVRSAR